jgi:hypothetical protein
MEAAVSGIFVFGATGVTHGECHHGGKRPIIGDAGNYGIPGAAVGAVDEGIEIAPVVRVKKFPQTIRTDIAVRGYLGLVRPSGARPDHKTLVSLRSDFLTPDRGYGGQGGCFRGDIPQKRGDIRLPPFRLDNNPAGIVQHPAVDSMRPGQPEYKGAKTDPLDNPFYFDAYSIDSHNLNQVQVQDLNQVHDQVWVLCTST